MIALSVLALATTTAALPPAVAPDEHRLTLTAGFALVRIGVPAIPVLTGELEWGFGLAERLDVRVRYTTHLGMIHRAGPELRYTAGPWDETFTLGARLHPSVQLAGAAQAGIDVGGDVATEIGVIAAYDAGPWSLALELGATVQWLLFESIDGRTHVDATPFLLAYEPAVSFTAPIHDAVAFTARVELDVSGEPDDPFAVLGMRPRLLAGAVVRL